MIGIARPNAVHLFADGAFFDPSDRTRPGATAKFEALKIYQLGDMNAAFTCRGDMIQFLALPEAVQKYKVKTFDDLLFNFEKVLDAFDWQVGQHDDNEILIAGWSERQGRGMLIFRPMHDKTPGTLKGACYVVEAFSTGDLTMLMEIGENVTGADGVRLMQAARASDAGRDIGGHIGGHIAHAVVTKDGPPTIDVVHEWGDVSQVGMSCSL